MIPEFFFFPGYGGAYSTFLISDTDKTDVDLGGYGGGYNQSGGGYGSGGYPGGGGGPYGGGGSGGGSGL